jgi:energy-converting hydrogenase Eha subunit G
MTRLSVALFVLSGFLLMSMGGAVVAAPLTLPLLYLAARRHPTRAFRWAAGIIGGLTAVELAWALVYFVDGEARPSIWLLPLAAGLAWLVACVTARRQLRRSSRSPSRNHSSTPSSNRR